MKKHVQSNECIYSIIIDVFIYLFLARIISNQIPMIPIKEAARTPPLFFTHLNTRALLVMAWSHDFHMLIKGFTGCYIALKVDVPHCVALFI